jgi:hypothetical protein
LSLRTISWADNSCHSWHADGRCHRIEYVRFCWRIHKRLSKHIELGPGDDFKVCPDRQFKFNFVQSSQLVL